MSNFSMGLNTFKVPYSMHAENRSRLITTLLSPTSPIFTPAEKTLLAKNGGVVFLKGAEDTARNETDHENAFRQESYFQYLFGVKEAGFAGAIYFKPMSLEVDGVDGGRVLDTTLFAPKLPEDYAVWMGRIKEKEEFKTEYEVDHCLFDEDVPSYLNQFPPQALIFLLSGLNTDSGNTSLPPTFSPGSIPQLLNTTVLHPLLAQQRTIKSTLELKLMAHVSSLGSQCHVHTMRSTKPGMMEYQLESLYLHHAYFNFGCRNTGYTSICACGPNPAVLHYGHAGAPNDCTIREQDMMLLDMGSEYHCYTSDITCSFPASGKFTKEQRIVYEGVLNAQVEVFKIMRPGTSYALCHETAEKEVLRALVKLGVLLIPPGDIEEELQKAVKLRLGSLFQPHGLGHLIGIDCHDVGGYGLGLRDRSDEEGLSKLRMSRDMEANMTLTVEPGCYFISHLIDRGLNSPVFAPYIVEDKINAMRGFGGVRLEDVIAITESGMENYTTCPRSVEEVESVMRGDKWPPAKDCMPELFRVNLFK